MNIRFPMGKGKYKGIFFILGMETSRKSFLAGVLKEGEIIALGSFSAGIKSTERQSLEEAIRNNQTCSEAQMIHIDPAICVELSYIDIQDGQLIEPSFISFQLQEHWETCTWDRLILAAATEEKVNITHPEKTIWTIPSIPKERFLAYLIRISPYMLPFLADRRLTAIRFPNGIPGESFFQKNCPDYAPDFIKIAPAEGNNYIVCDSLSSLLWLGNQSAIEYHVPFSQVDSNLPVEIVFDLDPPDRDAFHLAIKAARHLNDIFTSFRIVSFPKLSGSKGIQVHIPIAQDSLTYEDTRVFTEFVASYLTEQYPDSFTTERLKKNRGGRLYLDYVQHAPGKTIICPYSLRGKEGATVAAPLFWEEVNKDLRMEDYTLTTVLERLDKGDCPMKDYWKHGNPSLTGIISQLKENKVKL
ncbi:DNA ligase D [Bacillus testis]|uniref:DNA ligase D n=1 Tax=Bacillus testis TaxID=1622072 RepID=UPI00067EAB72|nr:DNA ligase D [Bacillus testis]